MATRGSCGKGAINRIMRSKYEIEEKQKNLDWKEEENNNGKSDKEKRKVTFEERRWKRGKVVRRNKDRFEEIKKEVRGSDEGSEKGNEKDSRIHKGK